MAFSASDIQAVLDSKNGASSFAIQNSDSVNVANVDSLGNATFNGNSTTVGKATANGGLVISTDATFNGGMSVAGHSVLNSAGVTGALTAGNLTAGATTVDSLYSRGAVGIGTVTPASSLDIRGGGVRIWSGNAGAGQDQLT
ncbi:MAG: hypothetical protein HQL20_04505, partial [Candidatus Omnitrophica bacterium]|nr:hypothetical protein [Candidatus Omnitrophota bacterium]